MYQTNELYRRSFQIKTEYIPDRHIRSYNLKAI